MAIGKSAKVRNTSSLATIRPWLLSMLETLLIRQIQVIIYLLDLGFKIIGAHTDSPCLKIAPRSKASFKSFAQSYVMTYGGGLWHTWFDRDLILAGKIVYQDGDKYTSKLWRSKKALLKIPNLAIHLRTDRNKFEPNT